MTNNGGAGMRVVLLAVVAVLAVTASAAAATPPVKDPRVCALTRATKTETGYVCSRAAAVMAMRRLLQVRMSLPLIYQGPTGCSPAGGMLRWSCWYGGTAAAPSGRVSVVFAKKPSGWTQTFRVTVG